MKFAVVTNKDGIAGRKRDMRGSGDLCHIPGRYLVFKTERRT